MPEHDRKFLFDVNIFDAPPKDEDLPPPPPVFSEEELAVARDMSFELGRQQGQKEQLESREEFVAQVLSKIASNFSHLFAAETLRENIFERESLCLALMSLELLFPALNEKLGHDEVKKVIEKTLIDHRKTKEITIFVPSDLKGEIEVLIDRIRKDEPEAANWRVIEDPALLAGDCRLEWSDGGAIRDSLRTAQDIKQNIEVLLGVTPHLPLSPELGDSVPRNSDVSSKGDTESSGETP